MTLDENKALAQRLYDDLFNRAQLALADTLVTAAFVDHAAPPGAPDGPVGLRQAVALLRDAFPDSRHVIEDLIADEDRVVVRVTLMGTHAGPFHGIAPTGQRIAQAQIHILRVVDGKVVERWAVQDDLGVLRQLGQGGEDGA